MTQLKQLVRMVFCVSVLQLCIACETVKTVEKAEQPWVELTSGQLDENWREGKADDDWFVAGKVKVDSGNPKLLTTEEGFGVLVNGKKGKTRNLFSKVEHGDIELSVKIMIPKGSNSGIYFMGRYEVQILDSFGVKKVKHGDMGGIYQQWDPARGKGGEGFNGIAPRLNAAREPGVWQNLRVVFRAPRFNKDGQKIAHAQFVTVHLNGNLIHENVEVKGPTRSRAFQNEVPSGPIMLQGDHGPVAFRHFRIKYMDLSDTIPTQFAGRTVEQWVARMQHRERVFRHQAANTLSNIGPAGLPALRVILKHGDPVMRYWACHGYAQTRREHREEISELITLLKDDNADVRMMAAYALRFTKHHDSAIDVLIAELEVRRQGHANVAADYLGFIGVRASKALPVLQELAKDKDYHLKNAAVRALGRIQK